MATKPSWIRSPWRVRAPPELRAAVVAIEREEYLLLEWPLRPRQLPARLTPAEREVAQLLLAGLSNAGIASRRSTRVRTVAKQVASVFSKLGIGSRLELFALASSGARPRPSGNRQ